MISYPTWLIVADGGGARFFVRQLQDLPLQELEELAETADLLHGKHKAHDDVGHGHHAVTARTTPHERAEQVFVRHVAGQIDRAVIENQVGSLVLCAPPRALGLLRDFISENARRLIACEITTDAVRETVANIDARMKANHV
jgi:protein required for attachment to host cells